MLQRRALLSLLGGLKGSRSNGIIALRRWPTWRVFSFSTRASQHVVVREYPIHSPDGKAKESSTPVAVWVQSPSSSTKTHRWKKRIDHPPASSPDSTPWHSGLQTHATRYFFPTGYPASVASGYATFAWSSACASIAGSASMVLSTQTLFIAMGCHHAGMAAAASNWMLKDGIGQAACAIMIAAGQSRSYDDAPKTWRMVAAAALDGAAAIEIGAALWWKGSAEDGMILAAACFAGVLKNIGFLTASASRAALHQALVANNNLADVTVKSGSQSMVAGLMGTALGLGLANVCQDNGVAFGVLYCMLVGIHQYGNYKAVQSVALKHFNPTRLGIVVTRYLETGQVLTPTDVAPLEPIYVSPTMAAPPYNIVIGKGMEMHQEQDLLHPLEDSYLVTVARTYGVAFLTFLTSATPQCQILGFLAAFQALNGIVSNNKMEANEGDNKFLKSLKEAGWNLSATRLETGAACRLQVHGGDEKIEEAARKVIRGSCGP